MTPGGSYDRDGGTIADKGAGGHTVTGLSPATDYYFTVRTESDSPNTIVSLDRAETAGATLDETCTAPITVPTLGAWARWLLTLLLLTAGWRLRRRACWSGWILPEPRSATIRSI